MWRGPPDGFGLAGLAVTHSRALELTVSALPTVEMFFVIITAHVKNNFSETSSGLRVLTHRAFMLVKKDDILG